MVRGEWGGGGRISEKRYARPERAAGAINVPMINALKKLLPRIEGWPEEDQQRCWRPRAASKRSAPASITLRRRSWPQSTANSRKRETVASPVNGQSTRLVKFRMRWGSLGRRFLRLREQPQHDLLHL